MKHSGAFHVLIKHAKVVRAVLISLYGPDKHVERTTCVRNSNSQTLPADTSGSQNQSETESKLFSSFICFRSIDGCRRLPHKHRSMNSDREIGKGDRDERIWPNFAKEGIAEFL